MHELSIAVGIVDLACDHMARFQRPRLDAVHLRLGPLSGVVREALVFSFDAASAGTPAEGARLEIEDVAAVVWCPACRAERPLGSTMRRRCPECGSATPDVVRGTEMEVVALEIVET
jgi:hydrogenase nickel incorporation protein HypA/HybF